MVGFDVLDRLDRAAGLLEGLSFEVMLADELGPVRERLNRVRGRFELAQAAFVRRVGELNDEGRAPLPDDPLALQCASEPDRNRCAIGLSPTRLRAFGRVRCQAERVG